MHLGHGVATGSVEKGDCLLFSREIDPACLRLLVIEEVITNQHSFVVDEMKTPFKMKRELDYVVMLILTHECDVLSERDLPVAMMSDQLQPLTLIVRDGFAPVVTCLVGTDTGDMEPPRARQNPIEIPCLPMPAKDELNGSTALILKPESELHSGDLEILTFSEPKDASLPLLHCSILP